MREMDEMEFELVLDVFLDNGMQWKQLAMEADCSGAGCSNT